MAQGARSVKYFRQLLARGALGRLGGLFRADSGACCIRKPDTRLFAWTLGPASCGVVASPRAMAHRFLVVEDDVTILAFVESALQSEGLEVVSASSTAEARALLAARPDAAEFCLIIDVVLEHESGIDFAEELLRRHPGCQVLFISGFTDDVVVVEPDFARRTAFLAKPFGKDELLQALARICR